MPISTLLTGDARKIMFCYVSMVEVFCICILGECVHLLNRVLFPSMFYTAGVSACYVCSKSRYTLDDIVVKSVLNMWNSDLGAHCIS